MFVQHLWQRSLHLILCEIEELAANDIAEWQHNLPANVVAELHRGDWRSRLSQGLPTDATAYLISFDPYMFDRHGPPAVPKPGNMYPTDIERVGAAVLALEKEGAPIVLQLSTYSANHANRQGDVVSTIEPLLKVAGLKLATNVRADGHMMSMVFTRNISTVSDAGLEQRFAVWIEQAI